MVFNHEQWHETRVKHHIWDERILYANVTWERFLKHIKTSAFSVLGLLQGFDNTWGARNVLCRRHNLHIERNWKKCNYHLNLLMKNKICCVNLIGRSGKHGGEKTK